MPAYRAAAALLPDGWMENVTIEVSGAGDITAVVVEDDSGRAEPGWPRAAAISGAGGR